MAEKVHTLRGSESPVEVPLRAGSGSLRRLNASQGARPACGMRPPSVLQPGLQVLRGAGLCKSLPGDQEDRPFFPRPRPSEQCRGRRWTAGDPELLGALGAAGAGTTPRPAQLQEPPSPLRLGTCALVSVPVLSLRSFSSASLCARIGVRAQAARAPPLPRPTSPVCGSSCHPGAFGKGSVGHGACRGSQAHGDTQLGPRRGCPGPQNKTS